MVDRGLYANRIARPHLEEEDRKVNMTDHAGGAKGQDFADQGIGPITRTSDQREQQQQPQIDENQGQLPYQMYGQPQFPSFNMPSSGQNYSQFDVMNAAGVQGTSQTAMRMVQQQGAPYQMTQPLNQLYSMPNVLQGVVSYPQQRQQDGGGFQYDQNQMQQQLMQQQQQQSLNQATQAIQQQQQQQQGSSSGQSIQNQTSLSVGSLHMTNQGMAGSTQDRQETQFVECIFPTQESEGEGDTGGSAGPEYAGASYSAPAPPHAGSIQAAQLQFPRIHLSGARGRGNAGKSTHGGGKSRRRSSVSTTGMQSRAKLGPSIDVSRIPRTYMTAELLLQESPHPKTGVLWAAIHPGVRSLLYDTYSQLEELKAQLAQQNSAGAQFAGQSGMFMGMGQAIPLSNRALGPSPQPQLSRRSDFRGVSRNGSKWSAMITHANKRIYIGSFDTQDEAAEAYNLKAKELLGDKAVLNRISTQGSKDTDTSTGNHARKRAAGTSKFVGVSKASGRWAANVGANDKLYRIGLYDTEAEAAYAYDEVVSCIGRDTNKVTQGQLSDARSAFNSAKSNPGSRRHSRSSDNMEELPASKPRPEVLSKSSMVDDHTLVAISKS